MIRSFAVRPRRRIGSIVLSALATSMVLGDAAGAGAESAPSNVDASTAGVISPDTSGGAAWGPATGSGFYVRTGIGLERSTGTRFTDKDCTLTTNNNSGGYQALYGCGTGWDGAPLSSKGTFGSMRGFEFGAGYAASPFLRLEAVVQRRTGLSFKGKSNFLDGVKREDVEVDASALSAMLAAYLDLPEFRVAEIGTFRPFAGGGFGYSRLKIGEMRQRFPITTTLVPGRKSTSFAWMVALGASTPVAERVTLDLAVRYTHLGTVKSGWGGGSVVFPDTEQFADRNDIPLNLPETRANLASVGLWASLRYAF